MRKLTAERRKMLSLRITRRRRVLKLQAIEYKGGKCSRCGYDKSVAALEFHHLDPKQKERGIGNGRTISWDRVKAEIEKCVLVCANCHREIHEEWKSEEREKQELVLAERKRKPKTKTQCKSCGKNMEVSTSSFHENMTCSVKCRSINSEKVTWPSIDTLLQMVKELGKSETGRRLGVSDKAVAKRIKNRQDANPTP